MKFVSIDHNNIEDLKKFIANIGRSIKSFRYYINREMSNVINNHITTLLLWENEYIGYGHLDKEEDKVWLGICIKEGSEGKGYGKIIMQKLVDSYDGDIHLSVDKDNAKAFRLYEQFLFKKIQENDSTFFMKRVGLNEKIYTSN